MSDVVGDQMKQEVRKVLAIRLTSSERDLVERKAIEAGLPPATFIREAALRAIVAPVKTDIPEINREAWASLARVCANLNQYQAAINEGRANEYPLEVLRQLNERVQSLRRALIGVRGDDES